MIVETFVSGFLNTNTYVMEVDGHLLIIDPADHAAVLERCRGAATVTVLLTHEHFDHISGLNKLRELRRWNLSPEFGENQKDYAIEINENMEVSYLVVAGEVCSKRIKDVKENMSVYADVLVELAEKQLAEPVEPFTCQEADITFKDYYSFCWVGHTVEYFSTPGHSAGSCCIRVDDILFVGDSVLENNLMVKFPGSSKKLYQTVTVPLLEKLLAGNRLTCVYPGHGDVMNCEFALEIIKNV